MPIMFTQCSIIHVICSHPSHSLPLHGHFTVCKWRFETKNYSAALVFARVTADFGCSSWKLSCLTRLRMSLEFVKSNKGRDMLMVDGCTFRLEKTIKEKKIWKCTEYWTAKCRPLYMSRCHTRWIISKESLTILASTLKMYQNLTLNT